MAVLGQLNICIHAVSAVRSHYTVITLNSHRLESSIKNIKWEFLGKVKTEYFQVELIQVKKLYRKANKKVYIICFATAIYKYINFTFQQSQNCRQQTKPKKTEKLLQNNKRKLKPVFNRIHNVFCQKIKYLEF